MKTKTVAAKRLGLSLMMTTALLTIPGQAFAQATKDEKTKTDGRIEEIIVFAEGSRLPADISTVPGSVTLISLEQIQNQAAISSDLGRILASSVPGMSLSTNDGNNFSQTLRGRKPAFFIDGIPQSAEMRGGGRDLRIIHPNALQRVEVINGATSIYGLGGSGGVINYITKRPTEDGISFFSEVGLTSALSKITDKSLEYSVAQGISGKVDKVDFVANVTYQSRGLFYDADGDAIPPDPTGQTGIADMEEWSLFAKVGVELSPNIRWEAMAMHYTAQVDTKYTVAQGSFVNGIKSVAELKRQNNIVLYGGLIAFDFIGAEDPSSDNTLLSTSLIFDDVMNSTVKVQAFYKESQNVWRHLDYIPLVPTSAGFPPSGSQLVTDNSKAGARIDVRTDLDFTGVNGFILWGVDLTQDKTQETLIDGRLRTSQLKQDSLSFFAQAQIDATDWLHIRAGLRYDDFKLDIPDFQSLDFFNPNVLHNVVGANLKYNSLSGNFGAVVDLTDDLNVFGSWSRGFSIGNVVRTISGLRPLTPGPAVTYNVANLGLFIEPVKVDSFEAGIRYGGDWFSGSFTAFYNKSDLGATFDPITLQTVRAPERIWGIEIAAEIRPADGWKVGGSFAWMDSKTDANNDGTFEGPLDFSRVPPPILMNYVEFNFLQDWTTRIQATTLLNESRFQAPFGSSQRDVKGYTVFDLLISGPLLGGRVSIGIENLFNNQYFPLATYMNCSDNILFDSFCATAAPGARGSLKYSIQY